MEGVEQTGVDQVDGPDHGGRANEETTKSTSETVTNKLGRDDEQETTAKAPGVVIVELLDDDDVDGGKGGGTGVGHDGDEDVLLDVEGAGVEAELLAKDGEGAGGENAGHQGSQGISKQLGDHDTNGQWVVTEPEELVHKGQDHCEEDTEEPCTESASRKRRIIGRRNCGSDFENRLNETNYQPLLVFGADFVCYVNTLSEESKPTESSMSSRLSREAFSWMERASAYSICFNSSFFSSAESMMMCMYVVDGGGRVEGKEEGRMR